MLIGGCGDDSSSTPDAPPSVSGILSVASWWGAGGEQEALQTTINTFTANNSQVSVNLLALMNDAPSRLAALGDGTSAAGTCTSDGDCSSGAACMSQTCVTTLPALMWDVAQFNAGDISNFDGTVTPTTTTASGLDLLSVPELAAVLETIPDNVRSQLTSPNNGRLVGFPTNLHRENTLFYSVTLVGNNPPTSVDGLKAMCADYVFNRDPSHAVKQNTASLPRPLLVPPLSIAAADWIHRILLESFLPPRALAGTDPSTLFQDVRDAIASIDYLYQNECIYVVPWNNGNGEHDWSGAAQALIDGRAAMNIHGDWVQGALRQAGWNAGVDYNLTGAPGSSPAFLYGIDAFMLNPNTTNREAMLAYARTALDPDVQIAFSVVKGSTPAVLFDTTQHTTNDPALQTKIMQYTAAQTANLAFALPSWLASSSFLTQTNTSNVRVWANDASLAARREPSDRIAARFLCNRAFLGSSADFAVCDGAPAAGPDPLACAINATTSNTTCAAFCQSKGHTCLGGVQNVGAPCHSESYYLEANPVSSLDAGTCTTSFTGSATCVCDALP